MPTILTNAKELIDEGFIEEVGLSSSTGGRRAKIFSPAKDKRYTVGINISRHNIGLVLVNFCGHLETFERNLCQYVDSDSYYEGLLALIEKFLSKHNVLHEKIIGIGLSIPAIIDTNENLITKSHVLGIRNVLCRRFSKKIPFNFSFINDANAAGYCELSTQRKNNDFVYISLSDFVGGAVFKNGELCLGDNQRSGEFGHIILVPNGKPCYCGKMGCVDSYCSALVLSSTTNGDLDLFFAKLEEHDEFYENIFKSYLDYLAILIIDLRMAFDCEIIVGGYVGERLDKYIDELRSIVLKKDTFEEERVFIYTCANKSEVSAYGAALLHLEKFIDHI
jgi:predicted NBD/HSP70 family sugar kinase